MTEKYKSVVAEVPKTGIIERHIRDAHAHSLVLTAV
jgi:hypothetical protein